VAFEMAQQLHAKGQKVALLTLFDTIASSQNSISSRDKINRLVHRVDRHMGNVLLLGPKEGLSYIKERLNMIPRKLSRGIGLPLPLPRRAISNAMRQAALNYNPRVYQGRVTLFRAANFAGYCRDPQFGWGKLAAGGLEIHVVPGYYGDIAIEPRVGVLAEQLIPCLRNAQATGQETDLDKARGPLLDCRFYY